jgi:hypothetical protein
MNTSSIAEAERPAANIAPATFPIDPCSRLRRCCFAPLDLAQHLCGGALHHVEICGSLKKPKAFSNKPVNLIWISTRVAHWDVVLFSRCQNFSLPVGVQKKRWTQPLLRNEQGAAHQRLGTSVIPLIEENDRQVVVAVG